MFEGASFISIVYTVKRYLGGMTLYPSCSTSPLPPVFSTFGSHLSPHMEPHHQMKTSGFQGTATRHEPSLSFIGIGAIEAQFERINLLVRYTSFSKVAGSLLGHPKHYKIFATHLHYTTFCRKILHQLWQFPSNLQFAMLFFM